jgi:hypothetical protein
VVALLQRLLRQPLPAFLSIDSFGSFHGYIEITTLNGELKTGILILNKMKSNLECDQQ